jgi:hypothetical protein
MATLSAEDARGAGSGAAQSLPSSSKFVNDIMMLLDTENVQQLRREFSKQEEGLTLEEFVYVMKRFVNKAIARAHERSDVLQQQQRARRQSNASAHRASFSRRDSRRGSATKHRQQHQRGNSAGAAATSTIPAWMYDESQLVSAIVELFSQIDINGDGEMEWDEFTSFIVDSGLAANEHDPNAIQDYRPCPNHVWTDTSVHASPIERTYYFPSTDFIGLVEQQSPAFKLYSGRDCVFRSELRPEQGNVLAGHHMIDLNQYVVTSSSLSTSFYDDKTFRLLKSFHTPTSQHCMTSYRDTLYTAGVSGVVHAWDANKMEERHHLGGAGRDGRLLPESHQDMVMDLLTIPTLESLASASMDHTIRLWDSTSSRLRRVLSGHDKVGSCRLSCLC